MLEKNGFEVVSVISEMLPMSSVAEIPGFYFKEESRGIKKVILKIGCLFYQTISGLLFLITFPIVKIFGSGDSMLFVARKR